MGLNEIKLGQMGFNGGVNGVYWGLLGEVMRFNGIYFWG
jgi:hypothetical protein